MDGVVCIHSRSCLSLLFADAHDNLLWRLRSAYQLPRHLSGQRKPTTEHSTEIQPEAFPEEEGEKPSGPPQPGHVELQNSPCLCAWHHLQYSLSATALTKCHQDNVHTNSQTHSLQSASSETILFCVLSSCGRKPCPQPPTHVPSALRSILYTID